MSTTKQSKIEHPKTTGLPIEVTAGEPSESNDVDQVAEKHVYPFAQLEQRIFQIDEQIPLFFDLETVPDWDRVDDFDLEDLPEEKIEVSSQSMSLMMSADKFLCQNIKDIESSLDIYFPDEEWLTQIEKAEKQGKKRAGVFGAINRCRKQKNAFNEAVAKRCKTMSTTPEFCKIAAMGIAVGDFSIDFEELPKRANEDFPEIDGANVLGLVVGQQYNGHTITERDLLQLFWAIIENGRPICGFNIAGFDLPVIKTRSMILNVSPSTRIGVKRYDEKVIDLMLRRWPSGFTKAMKLKSWAKSLGIEIPAGDCDGSQVEQLMADAPEKVAEYVASDVEITREIYYRTEAYWM